MRFTNAKIAYVLPVLIILLILPVGSPELFSEYYLDLLTKIMIFGIVLLGYDILAGYTGLVSLGHAMFFGLGGYCAAFIINHLSANLLFTFLVALSCGLLIGLVIAYFSIQTKDIFFVCDK